MTKRQQRKFKKRKQREERIRQQRHRGKFKTIKPLSICEGYSLPSSYVMTGLLETIMVLAVLQQPSVRR